MMTDIEYTQYMPQGVYSGLAPNVFEYLNYREFLKACVENLKKQKLFSNTKFAKAVGFKSHSYLRMIIKGDRKIADASLLKLIQAFGLNRKERDFLEAMVKFNHSMDLAEKDEFYRKLLKLRGAHKLKTADGDLYDYYSKWYLVALREGISMPSFPKKSVKKMAEALDETEQKVADALVTLERLELVEKEDGEWKAKDTLLKTPSETQNLVVRNFHKVMISKALDSVDEFEPEERFLNSITMPLSALSFKKLRQQIEEFGHEVNSLYSADSHAEEVYQLNFQLFPLTKLQKKKKS